MTNPQRLDEHVEDQMRGQHIPGLSLAIVQDGEVTLTRGYGQADVGESIGATESTLYEIGSITKPITASAIMLLAAERKVGLDDPIKAYVEPLPAAWTDVRVRHLLTHTSGIKSYTEGADLIHLFSSECTPAEILQMVADQPLDFRPGTRWSYSNTNYYLLGMILEAAAGVSYWDFLADRFFGPLGMSSTRRSDPAARTPNQASGYAWENDRLEKRRPLTATAGWAAGSLVSTVLDLAKWDAALSAGTILGKPALEQMWTRCKLETGEETIYGFGWVVDDHRGNKHIWHNGGTAGFHAVHSRFPNQNLSVIVLTNLAGAAPEGIAKGIAGLFVPALLPPSMMSARPDPDPPRTEKLFRFLIDFAENNGQDMALMTPTCLAASIPGMRLLTAQRVKDVQSFSFLATEDANEPRCAGDAEPVMRYCYLKTISPQETRYYTFALTSHGRIADFYSDA